MKIHLILYSNNEPFNTTKQLIIESIKSYSKKQVIIHNFTLDRIKKEKWFKNIEELPSIDKNGRRDGYYNCWKAFITKDIYYKMNEGDILYYTDCSQHYKMGFTEDIDKLCDIVNKKCHIAGSVGDNVLNNSFNCCDDIKVWNKIIPNNDNTKYLNKRHVLNSWFLFKKCELNNKFINEWVHFSSYTDKDIKDPLVTYHHTADQSIFNILTIKYNFLVFYSEKLCHNSNQNKNAVLNVINNTVNTDKYFIKV
jgi:hypothetical protein